MKSIYILLLACLLVGVLARRRAEVCVIGGGGTAGSNIAKRLSDRSDLDVVALDEGEDKSEYVDDAVNFYGGPIFVQDPSVIKYLLTKHAFAKYLTTQETSNGFKSFDEPVPSLLGGGQGINGNAYNSLGAEDLDSWNSCYWTYEATMDARKSLETAIDSDPTYHGSCGPIEINRFHPDECMQILNRTMVDVLGGKYNPDLNSDDTTGVGFMYRNIGLVNGLPKRQSSYSKILKPNLNRSNLELISGAKVLKVLPGHNGRNHRVIYTKDNDIHEIRCKQEVVISAGAYGTPKLLQNSGIGDCADLESKGIDCYYNNPEVGKNLNEILLSSMIYAAIDVPSNKRSLEELSLDSSFIDSIKETIGDIWSTVGQYRDVEKRQALPSTYGAILSHYYRSSTYQGTGTDMELSMASLFSGSTNIIYHQLGQLKLNSTGYTTLSGSNFLNDQLVTTNMWSNPNDPAAYIELFKYVRNLMNNASVGTGKLFVEVDPGYNVVPADATDAQILAYLTDAITAGIHTTGTASMHKVVDEKLNLIGVPGISVADNSIIPTAMSAHATSHTALLISEVKARMMLDDLN